MKNIYVFGNPDLEMDSLPIRLIPKLQKEFPNIHFEILEPNEDWNISENIVVIDTVVGIKETTIFEGLKHFIDAPKLTCHDFDAYWNLRYLQKLGKLKEITILGIPPLMSPKEAFENLTKMIQKVTLSKESATETKA